MPGAKNTSRNRGFDSERVTNHHKINDNRRNETDRSRKHVEQPIAVVAASQVWLVLVQEVVNETCLDIATWPRDSRFKNFVT